MTKSNTWNHQHACQRVIKLHLTFMTSVKIYFILGSLKILFYTKNWKFSKPRIVERIKEYSMHFVTRFRRNHGDFKPQHQFINFQKLILIILRHIGEKIRYHWNELFIYLHHKKVPLLPDLLESVQIKLTFIVNGP